MTTSSSVEKREVEVLDIHESTLSGADDDYPQREELTYVSPILKIGSENPSGKLGGNACCGHC